MSLLWTLRRGYYTTTAAGRLRKPAFASLPSQRRRSRLDAFTKTPQLFLQESPQKSDENLNKRCFHSLAFLHNHSPTFSIHTRKRLQRPNSVSVALSTATASTHATDEEPTEEEETAADLKEIYQELKWLSQEIRRHDALYYNNDNNDKKDHDVDVDDENNGGITDDDYDALVRREEEICRQYPELQVQWEMESGLWKEATRVGGRVGISSSSSTPTRFVKRQHLTPMLSLDNITTKEQLYAWLERLRKKVLVEWDQQRESTASAPDPIQILTEPKLDGLSLSLRYQLDNDNKCYQLVWACTRGDGKKGQDVTQPVVEGMKLPTHLPVSSTTAFSPDLIEIRGEVVLPKSIFQELRQQQSEAAKAKVPVGEKDSSSTAPLQSFSNARNAASGILLRKQEVEQLEHDNTNDPTTTTTTTTANDATPSTLALQSMLQFYAYDMSAPLENKDDNEVEWMEDALGYREQLDSWGFQVASPMAITTLEWRRNETAILVEKQTSSSYSAVEFESWSDADIQPMLDYHAALGKHREWMLEQEEQKQSAKAKAQAKTKPKKKDDGGGSKFDWGDYDMDGCVHKVSQASLRRLAGNSNRAPRWAVAHKYPSQSAITKLLGIEVQVGRKVGALTPVAILEPVELAGGVTVTRATLHNFQHMQQLLLGQSDNDNDNDNGNDTSAQQSMYLARGSKVLVRRAGDVIPQVVQLAEPPKRATGKDKVLDSWIDLSTPSFCPACGSPAVVDVASGSRKKETGASRGQVLRCGGPQLLCPPRAVGALVHAYSRDALDISGLSEARIQQLTSLNSALEDANNNETTNHENPSLIKLRFPSDVFRIAKDPVAVEAIASLPGWGPKSAQNLANTVNRVASDGVSLARFIYSLSIRYAGLHSSKIIARAYGSVAAFLEAVDEASQMHVDSATINNNTSPSLERGSVEPFAILADKDNEVNKGIGPSLLSSLEAFSREKELVEAAKDLASMINVHDDEDYLEGTKPTDNRVEDNQDSKPFNGMRIVFTGSLASLNMTRKEAQALAKSVGALATPSTISKSTDLVVVGDKGGGKKLDSAKELGIQLMELDQFADVVNDFEHQKP